MIAETFRVTESFKVFSFGADGAAHFFSLPSEAIIAVMAESAVAGRIQILYDHKLYVTFRQNLVLYLKQQSELGRIT